MEDRSGGRDELGVHKAASNGSAFGRRPGVYPLWCKPMLARFAGQVKGLRQGLIIAELSAD